METTDTPKRLGDYEIIRQIGRGGMGVVYEARQRSLNRHVALKVLSCGLGLTQRAVTRFRREAEAAAKLHHTNIVPIYDTGEDRGIHYYAMELVDGPSLDQVVQRLRSSESKISEEDLAHVAGDLSGSDELPGWVAETMSYEPPSSEQTPPTTGESKTCATHSGSSISPGSRYFDSVARMIADVADALEHAHNQGVIHRDIKPSNLLLSSDGRLSVNDFGLARMLEQPGMTISGEFFGTPLYMSPEQITAGRAPLDHRTDIYSLGATLYELLAFQPPYPGRQRDQVIGQILHKEVTPPQRKNKRAPHDLETICLKAMDRDPDKRYQTAGSMAEDLRRYVNRHAISAKRVGPVGRVVKWVRRHPSLAASLLVTLLALSTAAAVTYNNHLSNQRIQDMERSLAKERAFVAAIAGDFSQAEECIKQAERLGASTGWVRMLRGQIALHQGDYDEAFAELKQAQLLDDSTAVYALLTEAYGKSGDEATCRLRIATLRKRQAHTFEDNLFKGMALAFAFPDEAIENLDTAYDLNPTSIVVQLLRSRAERIYAMDRGDADFASLAIEHAKTARSVLPDNPIAVAEFIQATIVAANIAKEHGNTAQAESLMKEVGIDGIDRRLLAHSEVRRARWQYFLWKGNTEGDNKAADEILREPLGEKPQDAYLAMLGAIDLYRQERNDKAIEVYGSAIGPVKEHAPFVEAILQMDEEMDANEHKSMLAGYKSGLKMREVSPNMIFDWVALKLLGDDKGAGAVGKDVQKLMRDNSDSAGHDKLYAFIAGEIDRKKFSEEIGKSRSFNCMAYFLLGIEALAADKRPEAKEFFRACEATDYFNYYAFHLSRAFLVRLDDDRNWMGWLNTHE